MNFDFGELSWLNRWLNLLATSIKLLFFDLSIYCICVFLSTHLMALQS